jgi:hypothetical protein
LWFFTSPKIAFGEDSLEQLGSIEGKRVLVITDPIVSKLGMLELVTNELKKELRAIEVFDQVEAEPSFENVEKVATVMRSFQPKFKSGDPARGAVYVQHDRGTPSDQVLEVAASRSFDTGSSEHERQAVYQSRPQYVCQYLRPFLQGKCGPDLRIQVP